VALRVLLLHRVPVESQEVVRASPIKAEGLEEGEEKEVVAALKSDRRQSCPLISSDFSSVRWLWEVCGVCTDGHSLGCAVAVLPTVYSSAR
jgi:hypothetical protein